MVHTTTERVATVACRSSGGDVKAGGLAGVFVRLVQEHRALTTLMLELRLSSDPALRAQLFPAVRDAMLCHERAEAQVVYQAMSKKEQTRLIAAKHRRTAGELETLVVRLGASEYSSASWDSTFGLLFDAFEQHTIEEESYYFPIAQRVLGPAKAQALLAEYEAACSSDDRPSGELSYARTAVCAVSEPRRRNPRNQA